MKRYMTFYLRYQGKICAVGNPHGVTEKEIKELKALYPEDQKYEYTYADDALSDKKILCRVTTSEAAEFMKNRKRKATNEDNSYESG